MLQLYAKTHGTAAGGTRDWIEPLTNMWVHVCPPHTPERIMARWRGRHTRYKDTAPALGRKDQDRRTWRQVKRWLATNHGPNMQTLQELRG